MSRVLIFGAGGFVGSYLCKEFLNNGYKVSGTDKGEGSALPSEVDFYKTDLMQADEVEKLIGQIQPDIIVNLAAISSVGASWNMPQTTMAINVIGALNIMEAARKSEQKPRILFVGSSEEYVISENPLDENTQLNANNPYGISKVTQEQFAKLYREQYGLKIYCVRPFNHTGIGQRDTFVLPSFCKQVAEIDKSGKDGKIQVTSSAKDNKFVYISNMYQENNHVRRFLNKDQTADSIMGTDIENMANSYMTEYFVTLYVPKANIVKDDEDYNMKLFVNGRDMSDNLGYFDEE